MKQRIKDKIEKRSTELVVLSAIIIVGGAVATASNSDILDAGSSNSDGLVAEYRFDTGAGNTAYDTAGNNDGTINGATWTLGVKGKALKFDGSGDNVETSAEIGLTDTESKTLTFWAKADAINVKQHNVNWGSTSTNDAFGFWVDSSNNIYFYGHGGGPDYDTGEQLDKKWHHWTVTYDGSTIKTYIDGEETPTSGISQSLNTDSTVLHIGERMDDRNYWHGKIDNVHIYSKALNKSQIKSLYNRGSWRIGTVTDEDDPSKVAEFSFQHQNSSHVLDTSGYNNHGERMNGVGQETSVGCKVGRCYSFDSDASMVVNENPSNLASGSQPRTMMAWFKMTDTDKAGVFGYGTSNCEQGFQLYTPNGVGDELQLDLWCTNEGGLANVIPSIEKGKWYHVTAAYNGSHLSVYRNGMLVDTASYSGVDTSTNRIVVGAELDKNDGFEGKIDQFKVFNRSLSQAEIIEKTQKLQGGGTVLDLRFNRNGGDKVHDFSGESNHASINGGKWVEGENGNALKLQSGESVNIPNSESIQNALSGEGATIAFWVELGQISSNWNTWFPWTATNDLGSQSARLEQEGDGDNIYVRWIVDPASAGFAGDGGVWARGLPDMRGERFLHVSTFETTESGYRVRTFINDKLVSESTSNDRAVLANASSIGSFSPAQATNIIDELKIYPYAISKSKVQQLYSRGKSHVGSSTSSSSTNLQDGLVLSQTFNRIEKCGQSDTVSCPSGMNGKVAVDESGEANHGELVNGPTVKSAGDCRVGGCLGFDGSSNFVEVADSSSTNTGSGDLTVSSWVNLPESYNPSNFRVITGDHGGGNPWSLNTKGYVLGISDAGVPILKVGNGTDKFSGTASNSIIDGEWHKITGVYNEDSVSMYIDGEHVSTQDTTYDGVDTLTGSVTTSNPTGIGSSGTSQHRYIKASIDQVKLYNRSLSKQEVWKLYTRGRDRSSGMAGAVSRWGFTAGKVGSKSNPARGCGQIGDLRPSLGTGDYWIDPDGAGGVSKFQVTCDMSAGSGGWAKLKINNAGGDHVWVASYDPFGGNDILKCGGDETKFYRGINSFNSADWAPQSTDVTKTFNIDYKTAGYTLTESQESVLRGQVRDLHNSTQSVGYSCDDDGADGNDHNEYLIGEDGNEWISQDGWTETSNDYGWWVHHTDSSNNHFETSSSFSSQDQSRSIPGDKVLPDKVKLEIGSGGGASWGYEENYTLVRSNKQYKIDDLTGNNGGTVKGDPKQVEGKTGKALKFDGQGDYIEVSEQVMPSGDFTLCAWAKIEDPSTDRTIAGNVDTGSDTGAHLDVAQGDWKFLFQDGGNVAVRGTSAEAGEDKFLCGVYNSGTAILYEDGKQTAKKTGINYDQPTSTNFRIGLESHGGWNNYWKGKLDDVRIYPYALSQQQVKKVMNSGAVSVG